MFLFISIHAPLTGSDNDCRWCYFDASLFQSTLPLRGATTTVTSQFTALKFQSTLPLRGATVWGPDVLPDAWISIHAPLTGSDQLGDSRRRINFISIHAPLTGSDNCIGYGRLIFAHFNPRSPYGERQFKVLSREATKIFQSTLPLRGATCLLIDCEIQVRNISIHAPLTGSDPCFNRSSPCWVYFNPRSPYGERLLKRLT